MYTTIKKVVQSATAKLVLAAGIGLSVLPLSATAAGLLTPVNGSSGNLDIRSHDVEVTVQDGYVITDVHQVFSNPGQQDLEALYAFPIPERALVSAFTVWIDGQPVIGEVLEKKQAREIYQQEKSAGREAGLTEQNSFRRFEIRVSPVRAASDTRIHLQYMQTTDIDTGIGRYVYPLEEGGTDDHKLAFWTADEVVTERFSFRMNLRSAYPVDALRMPNVSDASITQTSPGEWTVEIIRNGQGNVSTNSVVNDDDVIVNASTSTTGELDSSEASTHSAPLSGTAQFADVLNNDLVVYWRMAANLPGSLDLVAYKKPGAAQGTFMMVMTPGDDLQPIQQGRDWMFVLDISGSMDGKYSTLIDGVQRALKRMESDDRFRIVVFNDSAREITNGWELVSEQTIETFIRKVRNTKPGGSTNLFAGVKKGLSGLDSDRTTGIVLVTDGVANVGETGANYFLRLLKQHDARLFTFIMGNEANRPLLNSMAKHTNGFAVNISNNDDIVGKLMEATQKINHQAMHNVRVEIDGASTSDITPSQLGTVYRGEQLIVTGKYAQAGEVTVDLKAEISGQPVSYTTQFHLPDTDTDNPELERLWAFAKIDALLDQQDLLGDSQDRKSAIKDLAIDNGIVTEGTSMIVIREEQFIARNIQRKNQQRVQVEQAAQKQRKSSTVKQRDVDRNKPKQKKMFKMPKPSFSGGSSGSFDMFWFLLLLPLATAIARRNYGNKRG